MIITARVNVRDGGQLKGKQIICRSKKHLEDTIFFGKSNFEITVEFFALSDITLQKEQESKFPIFLFGCQVKYLLILDKTTKKLKCPIHLNQFLQFCFLKQIILTPLTIAWVLASWEKNIRE